MGHRKLSDHEVVRIRELAAERDAFGRPVHTALSIKRLLALSVATESIRRIWRGDTMDHLAVRVPDKADVAASEAKLDEIIRTGEGVIDTASLLSPSILRKSTLKYEESVLKKMRYFMNKEEE